MIAPKEYIKKNGLDSAKDRLDYCKGARLTKNERELKRLVESHELIERMGGLEKAKRMIESARDVPKHRFIGFVDKKKNDVQGYILKQAIADVESCR